MRNRGTEKQTIKNLSAAALILGLVMTAIFWMPFGSVEASNQLNPSVLDNMYRKSAPEFDLNLSSNLQNLRQATNTQLSALNNLRAATNAPNMQIRFNDFGGSPDAIYDFASQAFAGTPEQAGFTFLQQNAAAFGIDNMDTLRVFSNKNALGGTLLRFQQTFNGIPVKDGGIGLVLNKNKQVIMASGPYFRNVSVNTQPTLSADQARQAAAADLNQFSVQLPAEATNLLQTGLGILTQQASVVDNLQPQLGIYPTADGYKLIWKVAKFSTNPFGLYMVSIDAHTGATIARKDFVDFQLPTTPPVLPFTADIYPKYPTITDELKDQGIISNCNGTPCGQERVQLRKFHQSNVVTGLNGTLTGTHALVNNALATKLPFGQAARGTWHFRENNAANLEARTDEQNQLAEPAEHQDEINAFFFTTYLLEYVDFLHIGGDPGTFGSQGSFPDDYPNKTNPLPATVHIPNVFIALDAAGGTLPNPTNPDFANQVLGLDNAFALNLTSIIESVTATKSPVVVNPTSYGHGNLFNDLALEGTVPYHEGMHAITSPIAGLEGDPEGGALNEGQADMWAFTITDNPSLGDYVVNAFKYRQLLRDRGRNPDSVAYIRSALSTLKYSDIGTLTRAGVSDFEEHYDGEIYMSTLWDIREMLNRVYPNDTTYKRPQPKDGRAEKRIKKGTEIFERQFLGSMYILGTTAPDTMVKARDAMIIADQLLYSTDSTNPAAPGKHRAMIEQIFAAHELGINAVEVSGGKATISTQISNFAGNQTAPDAPTNVTIAPATARTLNVSWTGVDGALSYEILKRRIGFANQRQPNGKREFNDGDASTTGFRHVAFVSGNQTTYEDQGPVQEVFAPRGLDNLFDHEYVVRAIKVNPNGQLGFSLLTGGANATQTRQNLTTQVDSAISNINFGNGVLAFDLKLKNTRGAFAEDKTIYQPIEFQIVSISDPSVTVRNADVNNDTFVFNQTLTLGATSNAKRLEFNDPNAQLFSFDAKVFGNAFGGSVGGTGTQNPDGTSTPPAPQTFGIFSETRTGTLVAGDPTATGGASATWGDPAFRGITWEEVAITTKNDAIALEATLSSIAAPDLDFELRTVDGQVLSSSAGITASEFVSSAVQPNTTYLLRVNGFAHGPADFTIVSEQLLPQNSPNKNAGTRTAGGGGLNPGNPSVSGVKLVRFTVNPLTGTVLARILR